MTDSRPPTSPDQISVEMMLGQISAVTYEVKGHMAVLRIEFNEQVFMQLQQYFWNLIETEEFPASMSCTISTVSEIAQLSISYVENDNVTTTLMQHPTLKKFLGFNY